jgi:serine/threonine-protein kinase
MTRSAVRYQLGERLGAGGMAEVFHAKLTGAEGFVRPVAIKRILPAIATSPHFTYLFVREARLVSQLAHPNVVSVQDFDRDAEGRLFLVMELVEGMDLARLMASGPLPPSVAIFVVTEILSGLGYAHNLPPGGIVHRDVSPHNVLLSWEGAVKVSDFGLAWARDDDSAGLPLEGKPAYMSPEQVTHRQLDGRSDLFSVGVVLWEILTGERLFWQHDHQTTIDRVLNRQIPRPSSLRPVAPDLGAVAMRMLARDPASRYPTSDNVIEALAACRAASLRGRSELAQLLAKRFPHEVAARGSRSKNQVNDTRQSGHPRTATMPAQLASVPLLGARRGGVLGPWGLQRGPLRR